MNDLIITILVILAIIVSIYSFGFINTLLYAFGVVIIFDIFNLIIDKDR